MWLGQLFYPWGFVLQALALIHFFRRRPEGYWLYIIFFFPGVLALCLSGWDYGWGSMKIRESSVNSPAGVPIWPLKMMIPVGATLLTLQGIAEVLRCVQCLRDGQWAPRLHDVEELENQILQEHAAKAEQAAAQGAAK